LKWFSERGEKMLFDTHMHCEYSCDSKMNIEEAIVASEKLNIGMIVTEHWDFDYPTNPDAFIFDLDKGINSHLKKRSERVLVGLEIGIQPHLTKENNTVANSKDFDFIIASLHCLDGFDLYETSKYIINDKNYYLKKALKETIQCLTNFKNYDTLGHIDYITRYMPFENSYLSYEAMPKLWDDLLKLLIKDGKVLEINTRKLDDEKNVQSLNIIYKRYAELGGKYVTLGSDAHYKKDVGRRLKVAKKMAEKLGLKPVYFKRRKLVICSDD
jgi:histidinol-phosphatase (PHP family)